MRQCRIVLLVVLAFETVETTRRPQHPSPSASFVVLSILPVCTNRLTCEGDAMEMRRGMEGTGDVRNAVTALANTHHHTERIRNVYRGIGPLLAGAKDPPRFPRIPPYDGGSRTREQGGASADISMRSCCTHSLLLAVQSRSRWPKEEALILDQPHCRKERSPNSRKDKK